jgi:hypothetical protein
VAGFKTRPERPPAALAVWAESKQFETRHTSAVNAQRKDKRGMTLGVLGGVRSKTTEG